MLYTVEDPQITAFVLNCYSKLKFPSGHWKSLVKMPVSHMRSKREDTMGASIVIYGKWCSRRMTLSLKMTVCTMGIKGRMWGHTKTCKSYFVVEKKSIPNTWWCDKENAIHKISNEYLIEKKGYIPYFPLEPHSYCLPCITKKKIEKLRGHTWNFTVRVAKKKN